MSPILVRPVREQLEHDRVIRLLQAKYKRKFEVGINPGNDQTTPVGNGSAPWFPDLVLQSQERARKLLGVVEVETTESVNHLEAMSQWVTFSRLRAAFHLYVPTGCVDSARRLCTDLNVDVAELWAYQSVGDQIRFTLIQKSAAAALAEAKARASEPAEKPKTAKPSAAARPAAGRNGRSSTTREGRSAASRPPRQATPAAPKRKSTATPAKSASGQGAAARRAAAKTPARKAPSRSQKRR